GASLCISTSRSCYERAGNRRLVVVVRLPVHVLLFFFDDAATPDIYTLSLHDALPILRIERRKPFFCALHKQVLRVLDIFCGHKQDRKSTRLNSSHGSISYAVFCLKKKKK